MKTFIMLELPGCIKYELCSVQRQLPDHVDLVEPCKLHLTLRFLGITTDEQRKVICDKLNSINLTKFNLELLSVGMFNNFYKVFWCGVGGQLDRLSELAEQVESICCCENSSEFKFYPHITLGRSKQQVDVSKITVKPVRFQATTIRCIETQKSSTGTVYKSLFCKSLR